MFPSIMGILIDTVKRTLSRLLVLVVSMGYGVAKPTLGEDEVKVNGQGTHIAR